MVQFQPFGAANGEKSRTTIPLTSKQLTLQWPYLNEFRRLDGIHKCRQKSDFNREHGARDLPEIPDDIDVYVWISSDYHYCDFSSYSEIVHSGDSYWRIRSKEEPESTCGQT